MKLRAGDYYIPVEVTETETEWQLKFPFSRPLLEEVKKFQGRKWDPENKLWSFPKSQRNQFLLEYLQKDKDPYAIYDAPLEPIDLEPRLTPDGYKEAWPHQKEMIEFVMQRRCCIIAGEQGTGKSLAIIEVMERVNGPIWYVSTRAGLNAMREQMKYWGCKANPELFTFEGLKKRVDNWTKGELPPVALIGDECHMLKTHTSGRSQKFALLANALRDCYEHGIVLLCSGTPAPRTPTDWWQQAEITRPGFLVESHPTVLEKRLRLFEFETNEAGQSFPKPITWFDNELKCKVCGREGKEGCGRTTCEYEQSVNEVDELYKRLSGLVLVKRKKEVLKHLPDKIYRTINLAPSRELLDMANTIKQLSDNAAQALTNLRTLSDGFKYFEEVIGETACKACSGTGQAEEVVEIEDDEYNPFGVFGESHCFSCNGTGVVPLKKKSYEVFDNSKLEALGDIMELYEEHGRLIVYAAFHASIDRIKEYALKNRWTVFKVDGRSWEGTTPTGDKIPESEMLALFQDKERKLERVMWLAQPESSGTGLTLTESLAAVYYSNTFKGSDRMQSEDRGHREGMDLNKGFTIYDILLLPTDYLVRDNVMQKKNLQDITLGMITESWGRGVESC